MWSNFGLAIQVKHLSLDEELAENIVESISADKIVIVCKQAEQPLIVFVINAKLVGEIKFNILLQNKI